MKGGSGPQHLKICTCDTNREINMNQCRMKFMVKGIGSLCIVLIGIITNQRIVRSADGGNTNSRTDKMHMAYTWFFIISQSGDSIEHHKLKVLWRCGLVIINIHTFSGLLIS